MIKYKTKLTYDEEVIDLLGRKASEAGMNINILRGNAEKTLACEGCADIVFFGISLHDWFFRF